MQYVPPKVTREGEKNGRLPVRGFYGPGLIAFHWPELRCWLYLTAGEVGKCHLAVCPGGKKKKIGFGEWLFDLASFSSY